MTKKPTKRPTPPFKKRTLGNHFLFQWRKRLDMTLEEAAEKAGMTAGNLSAMERKTQAYSQKGLEALAEAYGVPAGWLTDVDPKEVKDIMAIWRAAKPADRAKIVDIAHTIVGKPDLE